MLSRTVQNWKTSSYLYQELYMELQERFTCRPRTLHRTARTFYMSDMTVNRILDNQNARAPGSLDKQVKQLQAQNAQHLIYHRCVPASRRTCAIRETFKLTDLPKSIIAFTCASETQDALKNKFHMLVLITK